MIKKVRNQQTLSLIISIIYILIISYYFLNKIHILNITTFGLFNFTTPLLIYLCTPSIIIFLIVIHLKKNTNNSYSYRYLQNIISTLNISHNDKEKAETNYKTYMNTIIYFKNILICLIISTVYIAFYLLDTTYISTSFLFVVILAIYVIIFLSIQVITLRLYSKYYINIIDDQPYTFIYSSYLLQSQFRGTINKCILIYKMNISVALSHLGEYEDAYEYLKIIWNENKNKVNKMTMLIINYNSYTFNQRLHKYDQAAVYKQEALKIINSMSKKAQTKKDINLVLNNIKIEDMFMNKQWQNIVDFINTNNFNMKKVYYQFMLYNAYYHLGDNRADEIYENYKNHILFNKLIEIEMDECIR